MDRDLSGSVGMVADDDVLFDDVYRQFRREELSRIRSANPGIAYSDAALYIASRWEEYKQEICAGGEAVNRAASRRKRRPSSPLS